MDEATFIRNWHQLNNAFDHPSIDKDIKYKRCGWHIVQMRQLGETVDNEMRNNIVDSRYAKFRASKLLVLKVYDMRADRFVSGIHHIWNGGVSINYNVGETAIPNGFAEDIHVICDKGIHYFNTLFAAYCYHSNDVLDFYDSGQFDRLCFDSSPGENQIWFDALLFQCNVIC